MLWSTPAICMLASESLILNHQQRVNSMAVTLTSANGTGLSPSAIGCCSQIPIVSEAPLYCQRN